MVMMYQPHGPSFDDLYATIEQLPSGITGEILEPGEVHTMSRPGRPHRKAAKLLGHALGRYDAEQGGHGWLIDHEPEVRFGERLLVPDLCGWMVTRTPQLPRDNPIEVVPDWVCEVLSPTTADIDRAFKLPFYMRSGVRWAWLIDPERRVVHAYESFDRCPRLVGTAHDAEDMALPPFDRPIPFGTLWLTPEAATLRCGDAAQRYFNP